MKKFVLLTVFFGFVFMQGCNKTAEQGKCAYDLRDLNVNDSKTYITDRKGKAVTGMVCEYYENGKIKYEVPAKDGMMDGLVKGYYESGALMHELSFKNGEPEGFEKAYYEGGGLMAEAFYKNGDAEGLSKLYYENGKVQFEVPYKSGVREGSDKFYSESGELVRDTLYANGELESTTRYRESGEKLSVVHEMRDEDGNFLGRTGTCFWLDGTETQLTNEDFEKGLEEVCK